MSLNIRYKSHNRALTLVEVILALALGALILASLTTVFKTGWQSWKEDNERSELIQHARVAMSRMIEELRYADAGVTFSSTVVEFDTTNLVDSDVGTERIEYELANSILSRSVRDDDLVWGTASEIAGSSSEGIDVTTMTVTGLNTSLGDVGAGNESDAIAVQVDLTLQDADGNTFTLSSTAKLRNK